MGGRFPKPTAPITCESLRRAGLQVLEPVDAKYASRQASYWSNSAKLSPSCIVQPTNAVKVAAALKTLVAAEERFAVRSGHTQWAGSNNIEQGVTINLVRLSWTRYDAEPETVDTGPSSLWGGVYGELAKYGCAVAGGWEGNVGVAGLILGGGNTFYTARHGFACDNVVEFEVVLADSRIITARGDDDATKDLFWALKGGSSNFGVVTNFRMRTLKCGPIWGGLTHHPRQATVNIHRDLDSSLLCFFAYTVLLQLKDIGIASFCVQTAGVEKPPAYDKWLDLSSIISTCQMTTVPELVHGRRIQNLHTDGDFWTQCLFQPLPKLFDERSAAAGGNAMGVERQSVDDLLFQAAAMVRTPEQETFAYPKIKAWISAVRGFAATIDRDKSQDPLVNYGKDNLKKLQDVAMNPGGFKISR
ncbi:hypothetical protein GGR58DRAFT_515197 [Xylaria digitata]|nr:hypothetical protein GGR58DRAFT_515197 [Xylaria digitata]